MKEFKAFWYNLLLSVATVLFIASCAAAIVVVGVVVAAALHWLYSFIGV